VRLRPVLLAVALLAAGCVESDLQLRAAPAGGGLPAPRTDADEVVAAALGDLESHWADALPDLYDVELEPLRGGYVPYGPGTPLPRCGATPLTYDQIAENALYCPAEDLIAWDREALVPGLKRRFGPLTVGLVMAHEFAHAMQARGGVEAATVTLELQADCFAGAWVDDVDDRLEVFATRGDALDQALAGLLELRDTVGVAGFDPMAHGSGFDRVGAFQDGFERGGEACVAYEQAPPPVVAMPFTSLDDQVSGGNLPVEELLGPLALDLDAWFGSLVRDEGGRWPGVDAPAPSSIPDRLVEIGDFAVAGDIGRRWAGAARRALDREGSADAEARHDDCLVGAFSGAEFAGTVPPVRDRDEEDGLREQQLRLSPGDLDEVVIAFLTFGDADDADAFARTAAFRAGFVEGAAACEDLLG